MKSVTAVLLLTFIVFQISAQKEYVSGYLIDNDADTIYGSIYKKTKPGKGKVVFRDQEGRKKTYYPRQIQGFVINDTLRYQSILQIENAEAAAYHVFANLIVAGPLNLLATQNKISALFPSEDQPDVNNYYVEEYETGKVYKLTRTGYRKQLAANVSEFTGLRREVMNKVYQYEEIPVVIKKYNDWIRERNR
jgi:hypothetical protein